MTVEERVQEILLDILDVKKEDIVPTATFEDLGVKSIDLVDIMIACENAFGIEIEEGKASELVTVQQVVDFLKSEIRRASAGQA